MRFSSSQSCNTRLNNLVRHHQLVTTNIGRTTTTATSTSSFTITPTIPTTNVLRGNEGSTTLAAHVDIQHFTRRHRNSALYPTTPTTESGCSCSTGSTRSIELQPRHSIGNGEQLHPVIRAKRDVAREDWCCIPLA